VLEIVDVAAGYGSITVLQDVTVRVPDSSVVALLGANGAGKTTLLNLASGLLRCRSGSVLLEGEDISREDSEVRARLGICQVPEGRGIFRSLSVKENLLTYSASGDGGLSIDAVCEMFPMLGRRLGQIAGSLSGGEQQMLALSRAYLGQPRVVLLDEVSMGLAPKMIDDVFHVLANLKANHLSLLLVEQFAQRALGIADYVYVMSRGKIVFAGESCELQEDEVFERYLS